MLVAKVNRVYKVLAAVVDCVVLLFKVSHNTAGSMKLVPHTNRALLVISCKHALHLDVTIDKVLVV